MCAVVAELTLAYRSASYDEFNFFLTDFVNFPSFDCSDFFSMYRNEANLIYLKFWKRWKNN
jgi:hypothetical protein